MTMFKQKKQWRVYTFDSQDENIRTSDFMTKEEAYRMMKVDPTVSYIAKDAGFFKRSVWPDNATDITQCNIVANGDVAGRDLVHVCKCRHSGGLSKHAH